MKNLILTIAVVVLSTLSVQAQDSTEIKLIGKTWVGESYEAHGLGSIPLEEEDKGFFKFNADKSCEIGIIDDNDSSEKGTWKYDTVTKKVSLWFPSVGAMQYMKIISITDKKLVIEQTEGDDKMVVTFVTKG